VVRNIDAIDEMIISQNKLILLTGTIVPNASNVGLNDVAERCSQYERAMHYYSKFGKVYFLENSGYDYSLPRSMTSIDNIDIIRFDRSSCAEKGKGFQEFKMIDDFLEKINGNPRIFKITGRYIIDNFEWFYSGLPCSAIRIDTLARRKIAVTSFFDFEKDFYMKQLLGAYSEMDDAADNWAEMVIYKKIQDGNGSYICYGREPNVVAVCGSTGNPIERIGSLKMFALSFLRLLAIFSRYNKVFWR